MHANQTFEESHVPARDLHVERCPPHRRRRRGPRSLRALRRRALVRFCPLAGVPGSKPGAAPSPGAPVSVPDELLRTLPLSTRSLHEHTFSCESVILDLHSLISDNDDHFKESESEFGVASSGNRWISREIVDDSRNLESSRAVAEPEDSLPNTAKSAEFLPCPVSVPESASPTKSPETGVGVPASGRRPPSPPPVFVERVRIWSVNARKLLRRRAELEARLLNSGVDLLFVQETWLSDDVESVTISGFYLVGRLDRALGPKKGFGGIAVFARTSLTSVALVEYVDDAERMWCVLHTNIGALMLGNWYRAPDEDGSSMDKLPEELNRLRAEAIGTILLGDLNLHHQRWLRFSRDNTTLGNRMWHISQDAGLKQPVKEPTRNKYLLDLVLSDMPELLTVTVLPEISDHKVVCVDVEVAVPAFETKRRRVWDFKRASWKRLQDDIKAFRWAELLDDAAPNASVSAFCNKLEDLCDQHIPRKWISESSSSHPWLDEECYRAIEAKCLASGKAEFAQRSLACSDTLTKAFLEYQHKLKTKIAELPRTSKEWWKHNRELLNRKTKASTIAPLKNQRGQWVVDPKGKADLLAETFQEKSRLPQAPDNEPVENGPPVASMSGFMLIRARRVLRILKALKEGKASGPDGLPIEIFKRCCGELALPIAILIRYLLRVRRWPDIWRNHRVHPLFKKGAVSKPWNYRGVHLTDVISKVVERTISSIVTPFLDRTGAYGNDQWAFRKKRSCRDLVALLVSRWLWALDQGFKIAVYLSDIAGAFDKVDRQLLTECLRLAGLPSELVEFLHDYLAPRKAVVVVQGHESEQFEICNEVFQGTVLGPPLWNVFFEPVDKIIERCLFHVAKFADDMTAFKNFEGATANEEIRQKLNGCQQASHEWGKTRRVTFDASKEHFCIIHRGDPFGSIFKLLGTMIDPKLTMEAEILRIRKKASPKINAILAARRYYDTAGLMQQYKAHVLCLLEASSVAIYHAAPSHLRILDSLQRRFLKEVGLTDAEAFLKYNLAPLQLRRDIGALGLLHKIQLGEAHEGFSKILPREVGVHTADTRKNARRHGRQFHEQYGSTDYFNRSLFSVVRVYNVLPPYVVNTKTVEAFQKQLTKDARFACSTRVVNWEHMYNKQLH